MISKFVSNVTAMVFLNILLYTTVLILTHQGIDQLLANIEKMHGAKVQFLIDINYHE